MKKRIFKFTLLLSFLITQVVAGQNEKALQKDILFEDAIYQCATQTLSKQNVNLDTLRIAYRKYLDSTYEDENTSIGFKSEFIRFATDNLDLTKIRSISEFMPKRLRVGRLDTLLMNCYSKTGANQHIFKKSLKDEAAKIIDSVRQNNIAFYDTKIMVTAYEKISYKYYKHPANEIAFYLMINKSKELTALLNSGITTGPLPINSEKLDTTNLVSKIIIIKADSNILIDDEQVELEDAELLLYKFINENRTTHVIYLSTDRLANYSRYEEVTEIVRNSYKLARQPLSYDLFGEELDNLTEDQLNIIRTVIPFRLREKS